LLDLQLELGDKSRQCGELSMGTLHLIQIAWTSHTPSGFIRVGLHSCLDDDEAKEFATANSGKGFIWIEIHIMCSDLVLWMMMKPRNLPLPTLEKHLSGLRWISCARTWSSLVDDQVKEFATADPGKEKHLSGLRCISYVRTWYSLDDEEAKENTTNVSRPKLI